MSAVKRSAKKIAIGIGGSVVLLSGIIMIPYPGPGWLVVFAGLAILAREFPWARRVLDFAKGKYDTWQHWLKRQPGYVKGIFWLLTCAVVIVTIWLLNGYGLLNDWFNLGQYWVKSPFVR